MDELELIKGEKYKVIATKGLNLRRESDLNSKILIVMEYDAVVSLESEEAVSKDGYDWYYVRYKDKTGWAASEFLELIPPIAVAGRMPQNYNFTWVNGDKTTTYNITDQNRESYLNTYFFDSKTNDRAKIEFIALNVKQYTYYTTQQNINTMANNNYIKVV
jgi:hypothetical protein